MDYDYLARERALQMAQLDSHAGVIDESQVISRARQYEAYLRGCPVGLVAGQTLALPTFVDDGV